MGRQSLWKRLWQQVKRILRALLRVTEGPRSFFRYLYQQFLYPLYEYSASLILPSTATAFATLPKSVNPFSDFKGTTFDRALDAGNRTRYFFEKYVHTRYPGVFHGRSYEEQMQTNPDFKPLIARHIESEYFQRLDREDRELERAEELIAKYFLRYDFVGTELIPEDFDEQYRQAIGPRNMTGVFVQKFFFWWADILSYMQDVCTIPFILFTNWMRAKEVQTRLKITDTILYFRYHTWPSIRQFPLVLGHSLNQLGQTFIIKPLGVVFYALNFLIGKPVSTLSFHAWSAWMTNVYFPFQENIYEPILMKRLYKPLLQKPWEDLTKWDPLVGQIANSFVNGLYSMLRGFMHNPINGIFRFIHLLVTLPGDLLYLVYLFFLQLEDTMYFYFLYPLTDHAIRTHGFGLRFMDRVYNLLMSFVHLVGYTRPTAILTMSAIFTSVLVFFLNTVPI